MSGGLGEGIIEKCVYVWRQGDLSHVRGETKTALTRRTISAIPMLRPGRSGTPLRTPLVGPLARISKHRRGAASAIEKMAGEGAAPAMVKMVGEGAEPAAAGATKPPTPRLAAETAEQARVLRVGGGEGS
jgi:hypothetical protein